MAASGYEGFANRSRARTAAAAAVAANTMLRRVTDMKAPPKCTCAQQALDARLEQADDKTNRYQQQVKRETDL